MSVIVLDNVLLGTVLEATYWAVTDDVDRLEGYSGYKRVTALYNEQFGDEDKEAWREHAPSESHPSVENEQ